jgi:hypothetical protein
MNTAVQVVVGMIIAFSMAFGQQSADPPKPNITGTVTDASGAFIFGAKVSLFRTTDSVPVAVTKTDGKGEFQFLFREVQELILVAEANCFKPTTVEGIVAKRDGHTEIPPIILQVKLCTGDAVKPFPAIPDPSELYKSLAPADEPIKTTVCQLVKAPEIFKGKMLSIRGRVFIAFEDFRLDARQCAGNKLGDVWLEYGRGPKRQPTTWCCGDMVPRDPLQVVQNQDFKKFHDHLTAQSGRRYLYEVTATLTGRFDAVETVTCPDGKHQCPKQSGFGHFGMSSSRLVIESVSDVVAKPIDR